MIISGWHNNTGTLIVLTVASGGTSLIVLGLAAAALSAFMGYQFSETGGEIGGAIYDEIEKNKK